MTRQIRTTLLTGLFFFGLLTGLQAQDKYEYGVVIYTAPKGSGVKDYAVITSLADVFKTVDEGKLTEGFVYNNFTPVNKVLEELTAQGWEVYNSKTEATSLFYVRRKK